MRTSLRVIDDFYADPDRIRAKALTMHYEQPSRISYPGFQSAEALGPDATVAMLTAAIGRRVAPVGSAAFGDFRLITGDSGRYLNVHADFGVDLNAIVYLTPDAPDDCGTAFFRHNATGRLALPDAAVCQQEGFADEEEMYYSLYAPDAKRPDAWTQVERVVPRYNRLVVFDSRMFHGAVGGFGDSPETARLTNNFFASYA